jgi:hypothetical protein
LPGEIDLEAAVPIFRIDLFDAAGGAGDAGVVDQAIKSAERFGYLVEQLSDLLALGHIAGRCSDRGMRLGHGRKRRCVDIANVDPRAFAHKRFSDGAADAAGASCNQHA